MGMSCLKFNILSHGLAASKEAISDLMVLGGLYITLKNQ